MPKQDVYSTIKRQLMWWYNPGHFLSLLPCPTTSCYRFQSKAVKLLGHPKEQLSHCQKAWPADQHDSCSRSAAVHCQTKVERSVRRARGQGRSRRAAAWAARRAGGSGRAPRASRRGSGRRRRRRSSARGRAPRRPAKRRRAARPAGSPSPAAHTPAFSRLHRAQKMSAPPCLHQHAAVRTVVLVQSLADKVRNLVAHTQGHQVMQLIRYRLCLLRSLPWGLSENACTGRGTQAAECVPGKTNSSDSWGGSIAQTAAMSADDAETPVHTIATP